MSLGPVSSVGLSNVNNASVLRRGNHPSNQFRRHADLRQFDPLEPVGHRDQPVHAGHSVLNDPVPGNDGQNFPVITSAAVAAGNATISGTLNSLANKQFRIEFFANAACGLQGYGHGQTFIGFSNVTTDGAGNASFGPLVFAVPAGQNVITSTATDIALANTSEFSQCPAAASGGTTTTLTSSVNPSLVGQSVMFTATVSGVSPTGTVQFFDGATLLGTSALTGATATLTSSALAQGTHPITAVYGGDANNQTSTSPVLDQIVGAGIQQPSAAIPTLGWEAMLALSVLLVLVAARVARRRR